jgi:glutamate--cysteine ligase
MPLANEINHAATIAAVRRYVDQLFSASMSPSRCEVGVEIELLVFGHGGAGKRRAVAAERTRAILASDPVLCVDGLVSFEPGGQLELRLTPRRSVAELLTDADRLLRRVRAALEPHGIGFATLGVDPWRSVADLGLQTPSARYLAMERHFDAIGTAGRVMMRRTASLQVCVDLGRGEAGRSQWLAANMIGPSLAVAFTNRAHEGSDGTAETRTAIWHRVDPSRTGYDGHHVAADGMDDAYLRFALNAFAMPLPRRDDGPDSTPAPLTRFGAWLDQGGLRPDASDIAHHFSTLFPPVRPRGGYLEVRYVDAQLERWTAVPVSVLSVLVYDRAARELALEIVGRDPDRLGERWARAAVSGEGDAELRSSARELFAVAALRARAARRGYLPPNASELIEAYAHRHLGAGSAAGTRGLMSSRRPGVRAARWAAAPAANVTWLAR